MDEFSAIANDLTAWESQAPSYANRSSRTLYGSKAPGLVRLQNELQHLAVLVCVMSSAANALEKQPDDNALLSVLLDFCPKQALDVSSKLESISKLNTADQTIDSLLEFDARFTFAKMLTQHVAGRSRHTERKQGDLEILADSWRRASECLFSALSTLKDLTVETADNRTLVLGFLRNCIGGGMPCLTADGQIEIPGWAERRSATRVAVQLTAQASAGGENFEVAVLNASTIGLGLAGDVATGQHTTITFDDGRRVSGTAKWSEDGRFGLLLDQPLAKTDRLLAKAGDLY